MLFRSIRGFALATLITPAATFGNLILVPVPEAVDASLLSQTTQEESSQAEADVQRGIELTRQGHFAQAIPHFLAVRGHVSNEYAVDFNLALCYVGTDRPDEAISILTELRKHGHEGGSVENLLAQAYAKAQQSADAMEALHRAAKFTPKDEKLYLYIAAAFLEVRDEESSLHVIDFGLEHLSDSARLHYERAYLLALLDEADAAKMEYEYAAALATHSEIGYLAAAQKSLLIGNVSQAIESARAGIRAGYSDYQLLAILGEALLRAGARPGDTEFAEAGNALEKSIAAKPNYASSQISLGHLYLLQDDPENAIKHLEIAQKLAPQNLTVYPLVAKAYTKQRQPQKAATALETLARLNQELAQRIRNTPGDRKAIPGAAKPNTAEPRR